MSEEVKEMNDTVKEKTFQDELSEIINKHCLENASNTPDFIIAKYMKSCLDAFNEAHEQRSAWYTN